MLVSLFLRWNRKCGLVNFSNKWLELIEFYWRKLGSLFLEMVKTQILSVLNCCLLWVIWVMLLFINDWLLYRTRKLLYAIVLNETSGFDDTSWLLLMLRFAFFQEKFLTVFLNDKVSFRLDVIHVLIARWSSTLFDLYWHRCLFLLEVSVFLRILIHDFKVYVLSIVFYVLLVVLNFVLDEVFVAVWLVFEIHDFDYDFS